ncbi:MAG TPA: Ig-like domain-containing protein, partial [Trueperaceae bacterium]
MKRFPLLVLATLVTLLAAACSQNEAPLQQVSLLEVYPADGAVDVAVDVQIVARFDGALDGTGLLDQVSLHLADANIAGTLAYDDAEYTLTFTPADALAPATTYSVTLAGTVKALQGASLGEETVWSFTTAAYEDEGTGPGDDGTDPAEEPTDTDGDGIPDSEDPDIDGDGIPNEGDYDPYDPDVDDDGVTDGDQVDSIDGIVAIDPAPGTYSTNRTHVTITLDRAIDPSTLEWDTTVVVYNLPDGNQVVEGKTPSNGSIAGTLSYDAATHALTFTFDEPLKKAP